VTSWPRSKGWITMILKCTAKNLLVARHGALSQQHTKMSRPISITPLPRQSPNGTTTQTGIIRPAIPLPKLSPPHQRRLGKEDPDRQ
jgi:hypothetical protein